MNSTTQPESALRFATFLSAVVLAQTCIAQTTRPAEDNAAPATAWPIFRGDRSLTGVAAGKLAERFTLRWKFPTDGPIKSSPIVVGNRVWIGSNDGHVYAVDRVSGHKVWSFRTGDTVEAPPTFVDGLVVVGSTDGTLYALNAATGALHWKYATDKKIVGAANWAHMPEEGRNSILVGSWDNQLHCVDATNGKLLWQYMTDNYINGAVAVRNGSAVFSGCDGLLHMVGVTDGKPLAQVAIGSYVAASTALVDDSALVGHLDYKLLNVDLGAATVAWEYRDGGFGFSSSAAVGRNCVVVGSRDKRLHCVQRDSGELLWTFQTRGRVDSSPVICDGKVIVGSDDGRLYVVRLTDGTELWSYQIGEAIVSCPAVVDGTIFVGATDGRLYAFSADS